MEIRSGLPRWFDVVVSAVALVIVSPLLAVCWLLVKMTSAGPALFRQRRMGLGGRPFTMVKFRTMRASQGGAQVTAEDDERITDVGRWLRRTKVDELPELWNVLRGDMALVGPRPEVPSYVDLANPNWAAVLQARPGLTDPVTLRLRNEEGLLSGLGDRRESFYLQRLQPYKVAGYLRYLTTRSWMSDLEIIGGTALAIAFPHLVTPLSAEEVVSDNTDFLSPITHIVGSLFGSSLPRPTLPMFWVKRFQILLDLALLSAAFALSYLLRFDFVIPQSELARMEYQLPFVVAIQWSTIWWTGTYAFLWRYFGLRELRSFVDAIFISVVPIVALRLLLAHTSAGVMRVPLSVIVLSALLGFGGIVAARVLRRAVYEHFEQSASATASSGRKPTLLVGAGRAGQQTAAELMRQRRSEVVIIGFVDDEAAKQGAVIQGIPVLGRTDDLPSLVRNYHVEQVVITIARGTRQQFRRILDICEKLHVKVRIIPSLFEILQGRVKVSRIRDLEVADLLGREPVQLEETSLRAAIRGKVVAVTGAGGSIGSELARQVARFHPERLLLIERAEFAIFSIHSELRQTHPDLPVVALTSDVGSDSRMTQIFARYRPQIVLHAAAHKHVPLMEENVAEAVSNNALNTHRLGEIAGRFGAEVFVLISTDKAVRPTSVMGASKRVAELAVQSLNGSYRTRFVAVRFGNVIGSVGSVIPIFYEQIRKGGPVTVTHPEMKRYFMTIPEAAQLVLEASTIGQGGEILVLDMGEPVKILDLAKDVITLSGLRPYEDIDIVFTGIRPGEKLYEELEITEERMSRTRHPKVFIGNIAGSPREKIERALQRLGVLCQEDNSAAIVETLCELIPDAQFTRAAAAQASPAKVGRAATAAASD
ncbi:MAG TPA: polysaccharide biosynthesis protein [Verrucomicrobiae bacterium]|nr:polysaccharide biosynthesis protein [Verrucomicrobiae bacterium]